MNNGISIYFLNQHDEHSINSLLAAFVKVNSFSPIEWITASPHANGSVSGKVLQNSWPFPVRHMQRASSSSSIIQDFLSDNAKFNNLLLLSCNYIFPVDILPLALNKLHKSNNSALLLRVLSGTSNFLDNPKKGKKNECKTHFEIISVGSLPIYMKSLFSKPVSNVAHVFGLMALKSDIMNFGSTFTTDLDPLRPVEKISKSLQRSFLPNTGKSQSNLSLSKVGTKGLTDENLHEVMEDIKIASQNKNWNDIIQKLSAVSTDDKCINFPNVYSYLGMAYRSIGNFSEAEKILQKGYQCHKNSIPILQEYAYVANARKDWPEAITRWKLLLSAMGEKTPYKCYFFLSRALRNVHDLEGADDIIQHAIKIHPAKIELFIEHAEIAMAGCLWLVAIQRWQVVLDTFGKRTPDSAYRRISIAYRSIMEFKQAEAVLKKGISIYPGYVGFALEYAEIAMSQRDWALALTRWESALQAFGLKAGPGPYLRKSTAFRNLLDLEKADGAVMAGLEVFPHDMELLTVSAEIAMAKQHWSKALLRWENLFLHIEEKGQRFPVERFVQGKVADWCPGDWCHLAQFVRDNYTDDNQPLRIGTLYCIVDILIFANYLDEAEYLLQFGCIKFHNDMELVIRQAEMAMTRKRWSSAIQCWIVILNKIGHPAPEFVYSRLCLCYHFVGDKKSANEIAIQGTAQYPQLAGLEKKYIENERNLVRFKRKALRQSTVCFHLLQFRSGTALHDQIRYGFFLTRGEISSRLRQAIGDKIGSIDTAWAGRFARELARRISQRYGKQFQRPPVLPADVFADAVFYPIFAELSNILPLRHIARGIIAEAKGQPIYIEMKSLKLSFINFWGTCELEPLYLYAELKRRGAAVFLCIQDNNPECENNGLLLSLRPSPRLLKNESLQYEKKHSKYSQKAIVPDGIRGINHVIDYTGDAHIFTSTHATLLIPYSTCNKISTIDFTASIYTQDTRPKSIVFTFEKDKTVSGEYSIYSTCEYENNLFYWFNFALGDYIYKLAKNAIDFVRREKISELHVCDHLFIQSSLLTNAMRQAGKKVTLWPHSSSPVHYYFRRGDEISQIYCIMKSGKKIWENFFPNIPVFTKADMMLQPPKSSAVKPARQTRKIQQLSIVIIGGAFAMARLPRLRMNHQVASYIRLLTHLRRYLPDDNVYYRGKGSIADELSCLRDDSNNLLSWKIAMNHPLEIDYPNMIFISVSFGSSALLEGISRGIPGMVVRDFKVEDYTLLDPQYIPTGITEEIVEEIQRCKDYNYRMNLISRQQQYYCDEAGFHFAESTLK